ncbi:MAG: nuclear transport factor 2 family protein [Candidatus Limnocylindrales bacterium]
MADHPNAKVFRDAYDAFGRGDLQAASAYFDPEIVWHYPGQNLLAGDYRGVAEVMAFFRKSLQLSGGTLQTEVHDVVANDEHGVALVTASAERDGRSFEQRSCHVVHFRDGRVSESWIMTEDLAGLNAFWS